MSSFKANFQLLSWSTRILAVFPLTRHLEYRVTSVAWFWSLVLGLTLSFGHLWNQELKNWRLFIDPVYHFRTIVFFLVSFYSSRSLANLINQIENYDIRYFNSYGCEVNSSINCRGYFWTTLNILFSCGNIFLDFFLYHRYTSNGMIWYGHFISLYSYNFRQIYTHIYWYICFNLISRFRDLKKRWILVIKGAKRNVKEIEINRLNYIHLSKLVSSLSECFGPFLCLFYLTNMLEVLANLYECVYIGEELKFSMPLHILIKLLCVYLVSSISGQVTLEVSKKPERSNNHYYSSESLQRILNFS